jgi:glutamate racemase
VRRCLPAEDLVYFGDTAHVPYGTKSPEMVRRLTLAHGEFLARCGAKCLIVACNTASAVALGGLKRSLPIQVVGVIQPGIRAALAVTRNGRIGVLGTPTTIISGAYQRGLAAAGAHVRAQACPLFVPVIEEGWAGRGIARSIAAYYLRPLVRSRVDTVILGCTHYPIIKPTLARILGPRVRLVDSADEVARETERVLCSMGKLHDGGGTGREIFYLTDTGGSFRGVASRFLGAPLKRIVRISVGVKALSDRSEKRP